MHVQILSSGSQGNAMLVRAGETYLVVDAGLPMQTLDERFAAAHVTPRRVDHIALTHGHLDHTAGSHSLGRAMAVGRWWCGGRSHRAVTDTTATLEMKADVVNRIAFGDIAENTITSGGPGRPAVTAANVHVAPAPISVVRVRCTTPPARIAAAASAVVMPTRIFIVRSSTSARTPSAAASPKGKPIAQLRSADQSA